MASRLRPGPRNLITDVDGLLVGQAEDARARTGVTVLLADRPAVAGCDVRGGAPGTRETDLLRADTLVEAVDAITLSGGSVYGLGAADGVVSALAGRGRGFRFRDLDRTAPIVPAAILFDLANGGDKAWGEISPYPELGRAALAEAGESFALGTAGAGYGAQAGALKGGVGSASLADPELGTVGALACVNSIGSVVMPNQKAFWAWPFEIEGEFGAVRPDLTQGFEPGDWGRAKANPGLRENTTLAVVATDVALTPAQAQRLAIMAQDGLARAIRPVHTLYDGDAVFVLSTGRRSLSDPVLLGLSHLGSLAADCLARAVARGVYEAKTWPGGPPAWRDLA